MTAVPAAAFTLLHCPGTVGILPSSSLILVAPATGFPAHLLPSALCFSNCRTAYAAVVDNSFDISRFNRSLLMKGPVAKRAISGFKERYLVSED